MERKGFIFVSLGIIVLISLALVPSTGQAASFLKIDGIAGESRDAAHAGWIDVVSHRWLTPVPSVRPGGTARGGAGSLVVTKKVNLASTMLSATASNKTMLPVVVFSYPSQANPLEYMKVTLENVVIQSVTVGGSGGEDRIVVGGSGGEDRIVVGGSGGEDRLTETVMLNFGSMRVEYE